MSIERMGDDFEIFCEAHGCNFSESFYTGGDFYEAIGEARESGWCTFKFNDEWIHICPGCMKKLLHGES